MVGGHPCVAQATPARRRASPLRLALVVGLMAASATAVANPIDAAVPLSAAATRQMTAPAAAALLPVAATQQVSPRSAAEPPACRELRLLLRLHMYDRALLFAAKAGGDAVTSRCRLPPDLLSELRRAATRPSTAAVDTSNRLEAERRLTGADRVQFVLLWTIAAAATGVLAAQTLERERANQDQWWFNEAEEMRYALGTTYGIIGGLGAWALSGEDSIRVGLASATLTGAAWGTFQGALLFGEWRQDDWFDADAGYGAMVLGTCLGAGMGYLFGRVGSPTLASVGQVNSGGIWGLTAAWMAVVAFAPRNEEDTRLLLSAGTGLGLIGGGIAAHRWPMPRWRTALVDASGVVGSLLGVAVAFLVRGDQATAAQVGTAGALGVVGGLAGGVWWTGQWQDSLGPAG